MVCDITDYSNKSVKVSVGRGLCQYVWCGISQIIVTSVKVCEGCQYVWCEISQIIVTRVLRSVWYRAMCVV